MNDKIFNMYIEDAFSCLIYTKLSTTGERSLTFEEMEFNAIELLQSLEDKGYKTSLNLGREQTYSFLKNYSEYISLDSENNSLCLKEDVNVEDVLDIFYMGVLPVDLVSIISKQIKDYKQNFYKEH